MPGDDRVLAIMAKAPRRGHVKTRLSPAYAPEDVVRLYRALVEDTIDLGRAADLTLTVRIHNLHGITLRYVRSRRDGNYANQPSSHQTIETISLGYTLLGHTRSGAVDWRPPEAGGPDL